MGSPQATNGNNITVQGGTVHIVNLTNSPIEPVKLPLQKEIHEEGSRSKDFQRKQSFSFEKRISTDSRPSFDEVPLMSPKSRKSNANPFNHRGSNASATVIRTAETDIKLQMAVEESLRKILGSMESRPVGRMQRIKSFFGLDYDHVRLAQISERALDVMERDLTLHDTSARRLTEVVSNEEDLVPEHIIRLRDTHAEDATSSWAASNVWHNIETVRHQQFTRTCQWVSLGLALGTFVVVILTYLLTRG